MEVQIERVLFGYRARVVQDTEILVDYCCGPDERFAETMAAVMQKILNEKGLDGFSKWRVRPIYREPAVMQQIWNVAGLPGAEALCQQQLEKTGYDIEIYLSNEPWRLR